MSGHRIVLRTAAVAALSNFQREPWPTLAGGQIYDSKIEPQEIFEGENAFPLCVVYTDYDKDFVNHHQQAQKKRSLTLTIELLVVQSRADRDAQGKIVLDPDGNPLGYTISTPVTDSELETSLDIFESQIFAALSAENSAAECYRYLVTGYDNIISRRGATVDGGTRLSARQLTIEAFVLRDPAPGNLPSEVDAFLTELSTTSDYGTRVDELRSLYLDGGALTEPNRLKRVTSWSNSVTDLLGYDRGPAVNLGTPIVWLRPDGSPL